MSPLLRSGCRQGVPQHHEPLRSVSSHATARACLPDMCVLQCLFIQQYTGGSSGPETPAAAHGRKDRQELQCLVKKECCLVFVRLSAVRRYRTRFPLFPDSFGQERGFSHEARKSSSKIDCVLSGVRPPAFTNTTTYTARCRCCWCPASRSHVASGGPPVAKRDGGDAQPGRSDPSTFDSVLPRLFPSTHPHVFVVVAGPPPPSTGDELGDVLCLARSDVNMQQAIVSLASNVSVCSLVSQLGDARLSPFHPNFSCVLPFFFRCAGGGAEPTNKPVGASDE